MSPRIFMTGVTGFIGGQTLEDLLAKHPDYHITSLVRTPTQAEQLRARHPNLAIVLGDLDSSSILVEQSKLADIVIQAADVDHIAALTSISEGLSFSTRTQPGTLIQVSGAASVIDASNGHGNPTSKVWDDIQDLQEISHFPSTVIHAPSDQLVLSLGKELGVKTALLEPSIVHGTGEGLKKNSYGIPYLIPLIQKRGKAFAVGKGEQIINSVHVKDVASAIIVLVEDAITGWKRLNWGEEGVYYCEGGEYVFKDMVKAIAGEMVKRGMIEDRDEADEITVEEVQEMHPWGALLWGTNMRTRASRLRGFGWKPVGKGAFECVVENFD